MAEKRNITEDDIFLEARLLSEGIRIETKTPAEKPAAFPGTIRPGDRPAESDDWGRGQEMGKLPPGLPKQGT